MTHHQLRLKLLVELKRNADDNHHSRCREGVRKTQSLANQREDNARYQCYDCQEDRSKQNYPVVYLFQILARGLTGSDAGHESAVLLDILGYVIRTELD